MVGDAKICMLDCAFEMHVEVSDDLEIPMFLQSR